MLPDACARQPEQAGRSLGGGLKLYQTVGSRLANGERVSARCDAMTQRSHSSTPPLPVLAALAVVIVALAATLTAGGATTSWHEAPGPEGGRVTALEGTVDGTFYAAASTGLFVARNGSDWHRSELPAKLESIVDLAALPHGIAYVSIFNDDYDSLTFVTTDAGVTWRRLTAGLDEDDTLWDFTVAPNGDLIYAVGEENFYVTSPGGESWRSLGPVADSETVPDEEPGEDEDPEDYGEGAGTAIVDPMSPNVFYAGGSRGIYTSTDAGAHWTKTGVGFPSSAWVTALAVRTTTPRTLFAATGQNGVFKSVDGGATWRPARTGLPMVGESFAVINDLKLDPHDPNTLYAATTHGAAISSDGGASWRSKPGGPNLWSLWVDPTAPGMLVAGSVDRGVLRSTDHGETWRHENAGLRAVTPSVIAVDPRRPRSLYLGTFSSGLIATTDAGTTWTPPMGAPAQDIADVVVDPKAPRILYVGTFEKGVLKSRDGGETWTRAGRPVRRYKAGRLGLSTDVRALAINPRRPGVLYVASQYVYGGAVSRSTDGGSSWRRVLETEYSIEAGFTTLAIDPSRPGTIYAGTGWPGSHMSIKSWGVFVSRDAGKSWKRIVGGLRKGKVKPGINALAVAPTTGDAYATTQVGVFRLRRGAEHWTRLAAGLPGESAGPIAINRRTGAVAVGTSGGVYVLRRTGTSFRWRRQLAGPSIWAIAFSADGTRMFAASPGRFFTSP